MVGRLQQFLLVVDRSEMGLGVLLKEKRLALGRLSEGVGKARGPYS